jgi:exopolysaccharide biosynthesis polyprenyl glycosylphosphotransferase
LAPEPTTQHSLFRRGVLRRYSRGLQRLQALLDPVLIGVLYYASTRTLDLPGLRGPALAPLFHLCSMVTGFNEAPRRTWPLGRELWDLLRCVLVAQAGLLFVHLGIFRQSIAAPRPWIFFGAVLASSVAGRTLFRIGLRLIRRYGYNYRTMLIVGDGDRAAQLLARLRRHRGYGMKLLGFIADDPDRLRARLAIRSTDVLGSLADLPRVLAERWVDDIYLTDHFERNPERVRATIRDCIDHGVALLITADAPPRIQGLRAEASRFDDLTFYSYSMVPQRSLRMAVKRLLDIAAASVLLLLLAPVVLVVAALIKATSAGPVFFRQKRMTCGFREFTLLKFRSMVADADRLKDALRRTANEADGPVFKIQRDPRVTPVGRLIRRLSVDEIPQLINVLLGDMSMVGPRPLAVEELDEDFWWRKVRLSVKPGLTGLWQVMGRSTRFEDWVRYDLQYVENWSLRQDVVILLKTIPAVLTGRGAA